MQIKSVSFDGKNYQFLEGENNESENLFTILVGRNGSGKSRILQKICHLHLNSIINDSDNNLSFYTYMNTDRYKNINDKSHLNYGKINYQLNGNEFEINISKIDAIHTFYTDYFILNKKVKTLNSKEFNEIKKIIALSTSPFDKFPIPERNFHFRNNKSIEKKYIYRGAKIKKIVKKII